MQEREIQYLEEHIPELAESAVTQAYWQSLAAGNSVLESDNGIIYERFPDGSSKMVKEIEPPIECGNWGETEIIMSDLPRLRMFAGPNGSGKSTIKSVIRSELLGIYINPDEIEKDIRNGDFLDLQAFGVRTTSAEILAFFQGSTLLAKADLLDEAGLLSFNDDKLCFHNVLVNSYFASVAADFIRHKLLETGTSFTFETVMSSPDKVAFLQKAQRRGYRTYLYYVATEDPIINILRVQRRVSLGGHPVPEDKIIARYSRSLDLLVDAIRHTNRAYIFDNSTHQQIWTAEITDGEFLEMKTDRMPAWFKTAVWDKFSDI